MKERLSVGLMAFLLTAFLCYAFVGCSYKAIVSQRCLKAGWREGSVTWNFQAYCAREENEYEIVRPLSEVLRK